MCAFNMITENTMYVAPKTFYIAEIVIISLSFGQCFGDMDPDFKTPDPDVFTLKVP